MSETNASGWLQSAVTTTHVLSTHPAHMLRRFIYHRRVLYYALSLHYAHIQHSGIILTP